MLDKLAETTEGIRDVVAELRSYEPEQIWPDDAVRLVEAFAEIERLGAAGRTLAARRVEDSEVWAKDGHRSPGLWLAETTGVPLGQAISTFETARRLADQPELAEAFCAGKLSEPKARLVSEAAGVDPSAERSLVEKAKRANVKQLRRECDRVKAAAASADEARARYRRIHESRFLREYTDREGAYRLEASLTPDAGARVSAALRPYREAVFKEARKAGQHEPTEAYGADALLAMAQDAASGFSERPTAARGAAAAVHVLVDHAALVRGHPEGAERCEIAGVGPIPVETAEAMLADSVLRVLVTDGIDIKAVTNASRYVSPAQRAALWARDGECQVPGCGATRRQQIDHVLGYAVTRRTTLDELVLLCPFHHYLKTYCGYRLVGEPGHRRWLGPGELDDAAAAPP